MTEKGIILLRRKELIFSDLSMLCRFFTESKKFNAQVEAKFHRFKNLEEKVEALFLEILTYNVGQDEKNMIKESDRDNFIEILDTIRASYNKLIMTKSDFDRDIKADSQHFISSLPKISLPRFDGSIDKWQNFFCIFNSLIHNNANLHREQKYHYLRANLTGEALSTISNFPIDENHYQGAYDALVSRYQNPRRLASYYVQRILKYRTSSNPDWQEFLDVHKTAASSLNQLQPEDLADFLLFQLTYNNLNSHTKFEFDLQFNSVEIPKFQNLINYIELLAKTDELQRDSSKPFSLRPTSKKSASSLLSTSISNCSKSQEDSQRINNYTCSFCTADHYISNCPLYKNKTVDQRREFVKKANLCFNCLGPHQVTKCKSTKRCKMCNANHHTTIHDTGKIPRNSLNPVTFSPNNSNDNNISSNNNTQASTNHAVSNYKNCKTQVLLATAVVRLFSTSGIETKARALLDQGSEISFISENMVQRLGLKRQYASLSLIGIGTQPSGSTKGMVIVNLKPHFPSDFECKIKAYILPKLTNQMPSNFIDLSISSQLKEIQLADSSFTSPGQIDMIIGADMYGTLLLDGLFKFNSLVAQKTSLGWILSGPTSSKGFETSIQGFHCKVDHLDSLLQRFWTQEEIPVKEESVLSPEEAQCESHFRSTHTRNASGRYVVRLPFKRCPSALGESRPTATKMLFRLFQKFEQNVELHKLYSEFLDEYKTLGHMIPSIESKSSDNQYLPHHGVLRASSTTTKLRVVFNASAATSTGVSLNDILHTGPKLHRDLSDVIQWWRKHRYVVAADIEKMFRQILVHPKDWKYQHILWSDSTDQKIQDWTLTTVTYGLASAPYLANRVLLQLLEDEGQLYPLAVPAIQYGTYVDDIFGGGETIEETKEVANQLYNLCMAGGFKLQKWSTNSWSILADSPFSTASSLSISPDKLSQARVLGLMWNSNTDNFILSYIPSSEDNFCTKRKVLSQIAQMFDPLGWLAPVIVRAKIFMQELWLTKIEWDKELPSKLSQYWQLFILQLKAMPNISVPRWLGLSKTNKLVELLGFSDSSEKAMAAVLYLRVISSDKSIKITLLQAKTKVAPLKKLTIPRLELTAALMLTQLAAHAMKALQLTEIPIHFWTDSSITLTWIRNHPSRWRDYVSNRVSKIQQTLPQAIWHHINGKENPADCASRGLNPEEILEHKLWWSGPTWLNLPTSDWPETTFPLKITGDMEERRVTTHVCAPKPITYWDLIYRYSSLNRLLRITAVCRRIFRKVSVLHQPITPAEIEVELLFWVRQIQEAHFYSEIKTLSLGTPLSPSNSLNKLIPYLDSDKLLRVGGRLHNSLLDPDAKHPIILPKDSPLTQLIIAEAHQKTLHGGTQVMLAYLREKFWILGGRAPIKSYILKCMRCTRHRGAMAKQLMGQLPPSRLTPSRPFLNSGIDYAGPLTLKTWKGRGAKTYKGYIVLFICLSTTAIHLEVATDYTVEGFLAAFRRFSSRRGIAATLYSDCGTNLVGASSEMKKLFSRSSKELGQLATLLANDGTEWKFNPPAAPHFGGLWEAGVKSVKWHLRRVIGDTTLTYEELTTLLAQIEAVLNSRPLCSLSDDPNDINALTPGHFLIGSPLVSFPEPSLNHQSVSSLARWQLVRQMLSRFWDRWSKECLQRFQSISKWKTQSASLQPGCLVIVTDQRYPPSKWPLGRILEVHPGTDGLTRVATVKTQTSILKRPIVKLCPLPLP